MDELRQVCSKCGNYMEKDYAFFNPHELHGHVTPEQYWADLNERMPD